MLKTIPAETEANSLRFCLICSGGPIFVCYSNFWLLHIQTTQSKAWLAFLTFSSISHNICICTVCQALWFWLEGIMVGWERINTFALHLEMILFHFRTHSLATLYKNIISHMNDLFHPLLGRRVALSDETGISIFSVPLHYDFWK